MSLTIIIPVRNEEEIILKTLENFENSWLTQMDHEIIQRPVVLREGFLPVLLLVFPDGLRHDLDGLV